MSVIFDVQEQIRKGCWFDLPRAEWTCRECGHPISRGEPAILRRTDQDLFYHGKCAKQVGLSLLLDSREWELATRPGWRDRTVRYRLQAEDGQLRLPETAA